jgi:hypothetical protein
MAKLIIVVKSKNREKALKKAENFLYKQKSISYFLLGDIYTGYLTTYLDEGRLNRMFNDREFSFDQKEQHSYIIRKYFSQEEYPYDQIVNYKNARPNDNVFDVMPLNFCSKLIKDEEETFIRNRNTLFQNLMTKIQDSNNDIDHLFNTNPYPLFGIDTFSSISYNYSPFKKGMNIYFIDHNSFSLSSIPENCYNNYFCCVFNAFY